MTQSQVPNSEIPVFKNEPVMVLVLGLVTCGLYMIYWNLKMAEVMNKIAGRELLSPSLAAVGGICMPLNVYFYYVMGEGLAALGDRIGKTEELKGKATLLVILGLFIHPVAAMIVQGHVNELYAKEGK